MNVTRCCLAISQNFYFFCFVFHQPAYVDVQKFFAVGMIVHVKHVKDIFETSPLSGLFDFFIRIEAELYVDLVFLARIKDGQMNAQHSVKFQTVLLQFMLSVGNLSLIHNNFMGLDEKREIRALYTVSVIVRFCLK